MWFCTCLGKFCHKDDKSQRSLSFKWDRCDPSSLSCKLSRCAFSHIITTIQGGTIVCVWYLSKKWQRGMKFGGSRGPNEILVMQPKRGVNWVSKKYSIFKAKLNANIKRI